MLPSTSGPLACRMKVRRASEHRRLDHPAPLAGAGEKEAPLDHGSAYASTRWNRGMLLRPSSALIVGAVCAGCAVESPTPGPLTGTRIVEGAEQIVLPSDIPLVGGHLVLADAEAPYLRIFRLSGEPVQRVGNDGEGPGEFRAVTSLATSRSPSGTLDVLASDHRRQRLTRFGLADSRSRAGEPLRLLPTAGTSVAALERESLPPTPGHQR